MQKLCPTLSIMFNKQNIKYIFGTHFLLYVQVFTLRITSNLQKCLITQPGIPNKTFFVEATTRIVDSVANCRRKLILSCQTEFMAKLSD